MTCASNFKGDNMRINKTSIVIIEVTTHTRNGKKGKKKNVEVVLLTFMKAD